jgi:D-serine deaminase-like pyridoxal phosphate-dependent protein
VTTTEPTSPRLDPATAAAIDTPALVLDIDRLTAAIDGMAARMAERGVTLRPHAKTHKSLEVGRRQMTAGAVGLTVGTIGEAEVFAAGGLDDLFIAYPLVPHGPKAARLRALAGRCRLSVGVDSIVGVRAVAAALGDAAGSVRVLIEVDTGGRRSGVPPADAAALAMEARRSGLTVVGVFTHGGHGYASPGARAGAADDEVRGLADAAAGLAAVGIQPRVVSAGSTPTALGSAHGVVTEERPGTYVYGDRQQVALGSIGPDAVAAVVAATVVSVDARARRVVVDAGAKILGKDIAPYLVGHGEITELGGAPIVRIYDYHGVVELDEHVDLPLPEVGRVVTVVPNHICPVVNLVDDVLVVQDGMAVDRWPVDARGRNG